MAGEGGQVYRTTAGFSGGGLMIAGQLYEQIILRLPIACVDVIIRGPAGCYLLVRSRNEPFQRYW